MPYTPFDPSLPNGASPANQNGTQFGQSARDNLKAIRDGLILGSGFPGWNLYLFGCIGNAAISGTVMTVATAPTFGSYSVGQVISGTGITPGTTITSYGTGKGGAGTYNISVSHGSLADALVIGTNTADAPQSFTYSKGTERVRAGVIWSGGKVTSSAYYYSSNSGLNYDHIGTNTISYDVSDNVTATNWS